MKTTSYEVARAMVRVGVKSLVRKWTAEYLTGLFDETIERKLNDNYELVVIDKSGFPRFYNVTEKTAERLRKQGVEYIEH